MIEITYHTSDEKGENVVVKPPKNIRQIGSPRGRHKIYVEDYVHTYLHSSLLFGESRQRAAILLGRSEVSQEIRYTFIEGAINCEDFIFRKDGIVFDESCWEYIYQEMKQYFDQQVIVGWFLGRPGFPLKISHTVEAAQRKYFSGRDKVLYLWDPEEGEDAFFAYEQGAFQKKEGYYVYYEKNLAMQEYMVCQREQTREAQGGIQEMGESLQMSREAEETTQDPVAEGKDAAQDAREYTASAKEFVAAPNFTEDPKDSTADPEDVAAVTKESRAAAERERKGTAFFEKRAVAPTARKADTAIGNYRNMLKNRQIKKPAAGKNMFLYGAATVALIAICISGVVNLNSYQKMKQMEEVLLMMSKPLDQQQAEKEGQQDQRQVTVQTVSGGVERMEDAADGGNQDAAGEGNPAENTGTPEGSQDQQPAGQETAGQPQDSAQGPDPGASGGQDSAQGPDPGTSGSPDSAQGPDQAVSGGQDSAQTQDQAAMAQSYREQGYYVVQPGDRLELICRRIYPGEDMMEKLCEVNGIEDVDKILVGQKLILP